MTTTRRTFLGGVLAAPVLAATTTVAAQASSLWRDFDAYLRDRAAAGRFAGAALVTRHGRPLLDSGYGMADEARRERNMPRTLFCVGSMGKMLTAVAVAQLVERGRIAFTDPIGTHLPGFPPESGDHVTVHHLLTHTAGMGDIFRDEEITEENHTIEALMAHIRATPLLFAPGARHSYSNAGFVTLGALVQAVARRPYVDHLRRHVLAPAGMRRTEVRTYRPVDVRGLAHPYAAFTADGQPIPPGPGGPPADAVFRDIGDRFKGGSPAGGALSTTGDMIAFSRALLGHRLLGPAMTETVLAGKVDLPGQGPRPPARYAYGFLDRTIDGVRMVGHNGGTPGYEGELTMFPGSGHAVVLLTNRDGSLRPAMRWVEERMTA